MEINIKMHLFLVKKKSLLIESHYKSYCYLIFRVVSSEVEERGKRMLESGATRQQLVDLI